jgi:hypothetical protein
VCLYLVFIVLTLRITFMCIIAVSVTVNNSKALIRSPFQGRNYHGRRKTVQSCKAVERGY